MTLPVRGATAGAERAAALVAVVEAVPPGADRHEVARALTEELRRWDDLVDEAFVDEIDGVVAVIERIARIFEVDDTERAAAMINGWLASSASAPRLVHEPGWGWHVHLEPTGADWSTWLLASTAHALAVVLAEHGRSAWGRCAAAGCGRPFVDHGRRAPQRFCGSTCATRERVRRHRSRAA